MNILITFILNNYILKSRKEKRLYLIPPKEIYFLNKYKYIILYYHQDILSVIDWVGKLVMANEVNK